MSGRLLSPGRLLTVVLAALCGVLVVVLVLQRFLGGASAEDGAVQVAPGDAGGLSEVETRRFELPPEPEYAVIKARPLFHEDRRPEERDSEQQKDEQELAAEQKAAEPPPVTLTGVIITPDERIAMLRHDKKREYVTLKQGQPLEGWTLQEVNRRRIVFDAGGRQQIVELDVYTGPAGGGRRGGGGGQQSSNQSGSNQQQQQNESSAAAAIRERIERERERRRQLIEEARKRQQQSDDNQ